MCHIARETLRIWSHLPANVNNAKPLQPNARLLDFVKYGFKQIHIYKYNYKHLQLRIPHWMQPNTVKRGYQFTNS